MKLFLRYVFYLALFATITHICAAIFFSVYTSAVYEHRLINVRQIDAQERSKMIAGFTESVVNRSRKPVVLFAGSSFAWGYYWSEKNIFTWHLQQNRPEYRIVNSSTIGAKSFDTETMICILDKVGVKVDHLIIEISLANSGPGKSSLSCDNNRFEIAVNKILPYFPFFVTSFYGLNNFRIIWDEYNYQQSDRTFQSVRLSDTYFQSWQGFKKTVSQRSALIERLLHKAKNISDNVYFFVAPIASAELENSQFLKKDIDRQLIWIYDLCNKIEDVTCLPMHTLKDSKYFYNISHLNHVGHRAFAELLSKHIPSPGKISQ